MPISAEGYMQSVAITKYVTIQSSLRLHLFALVSLLRIPRVLVQSVTQRPGWRHMC
jgi:hypothetical protein